MGSFHNLYNVLRYEPMSIFKISYLNYYFIKNCFFQDAIVFLLKLKWVATRILLGFNPCTKIYR